VAHPPATSCTNNTERIAPSFVYNEWSIRVTLLWAIPVTLRPRKLQRIAKNGVLQSHLAIKNVQNFLRVVISTKLFVSTKSCTYDIFYTNKRKCAPPLHGPLRAVAKFLKKCDCTGALIVTWRLVIQAARKRILIPTMCWKNQFSSSCNWAAPSRSTLD